MANFRTKLFVQARDTAANVKCIRDEKIWFIPDILYVGTNFTSNIKQSYWSVSGGYIV